jgi:hypothetical protein
MKKIHLLLAIIVLVSCHSSRDTIIPYDYETNFPDTKNGLTQAQADDYNRFAMDQMQKNTVGKKLPKIIVYDVNNKEVKLNKLIKQTTFIYATDNHCGWGLLVLDDDLPYTIEKLKGDSIYLNTIALLVKTSIDSVDSEEFMNKANEVKSKYDQFYIIGEQEAKKFNALNATKLLVDRKKTVLYLGYGANLDPDLFYERLKSEILQTNAQSPDLRSKHH